MRKINLQLEDNSVMSLETSADDEHLAQRLAVDYPRATILSVQTVPKREARERPFAAAEQALQVPIMNFDSKEKEGNRFTKVDLHNRPLGELRKLAALTGAHAETDPDFAGQAVPTGNSGDRDGDPLPVPVWNFDRARAGHGSRSQSEEPLAVPSMSF